MHTKGERSLRNALLADGWSKEDIDAIVRDEEEVEEWMIEDESFFAEFMEASVEPA